MSDRLVTIATFDEPVKARIAANVLNEAGIRVAVNDETLVAMDWLLSNAVGGVKDLRWMTAETHAAFNDILLRGTRADKGMASFADVLTPSQVEAIHAYLIARGNEDYADAAAK